VHSPLQLAEQGNNKLEFKGDHVLKAWIPDLIDDLWPNCSPMILHEMEDRMTNNRTLGNLCRAYGLLDYSHTLSQAEKQHPPENKWPGDFFEAYIGGLAAELSTRPDGERLIHDFIWSIFNCRVFPELSRHAVDLHRTAQRPYLYTGEPDLADAIQTSRLIRRLPKSKTSAQPAVLAIAKGKGTTLVKNTIDLHRPERHLRGMGARRRICNECGQEK
jgi:hypothetical protein